MSIIPLFASAWIQICIITRRATLHIKNGTGLVIVFGHISNQHNSRIILSSRSQSSFCASVAWIIADGFGVNDVVAILGKHPLQHDL